jgi:hypothetical protein
MHIPAFRLYDREQWQRQWPKQCQQECDPWSPYIMDYSNVMRTRFIIFALPIFVMAATASAAEQACRNVLSDIFYNKYSTIEPRTRDRAVYAELCASEYPQAQQIIKRARQSGDDGSLGLWYGLFNLDDIEPGGKGTSALSLSEDRFRQWKAGYCSKSSEVEAYQAAGLFMQGAMTAKGGQDKALDGWSSCMRKQVGLACWATPGLQQNDVVLNVHWIAPSSTGAASQAQPEVQYSFLTRGIVSKFEGAPPKRLVPDGYKLKPGTTQIPVTRAADTTGTANLKVNFGGGEHSCKVFIPGDRDFTMSEPFVNRLKIKYPG